MKKRILIAGSVLVCAIVCVVIALLLFDNNEKTPALTQTDEEVVLGSAYNTASVIYDKNGTEYTVEQTEVYRNSDGNQVVLIYGAFDVTDVLGYRIVYTVTDGNMRYVQNHSLIVKDEGKPMISVKGSNVAEVGVKYLFPDVTIRDDSKAELSYTIAVFRTDEPGVKIAQDADGFTPEKTGYYELHLQTTDAAGNSGEFVFYVYARHTRMTTEIDGFDDEGLRYSAYCVSGKTVLQAEFVNFCRLDSSKGSACFSAGADEKTGFYVAPRNEASIMDTVGTDGYISVWLYISTLRDSVKTVKCNTTAFTVETNSWQELRITQQMVSQWPSYFSKLASGSLPLFEIINDGEDYTVFVDDVFAVKKDSFTVENLDSAYGAGKEISVGVSGGADVRYVYYYAGQAAAFEGSFTPDKEGKYLITVYTADRTAMTAATVTVGTLHAQVLTTQWYVLGESFPVPELNIYSGEEKTQGKVTTWKVDMATGERTLLEDTFSADKPMLGLYSECVADGKTTALFRVITTKDTPFGAWFTTDDPQCAEGKTSNHISFQWLEELDGEKGVLAVINSTGEEAFFSRRNIWDAPYAKEHYKRGSKLVFKLKATASANLSYVAEQPSWTDRLVAHGIGEQWQEYSIDFADIYENFDGFTKHHLFYTIGEQPYTIYIADISVVVETEVDNITLGQGSSYDVTTHPAFDGCQITQCFVSSYGKNVALNGYSFTARNAGTYNVTVCGYDHMGLYFENTFKVFSAAHDVWNDFSDPVCGDVWSGKTVNTSWLENYAGAEGVLKLDLSKASDQFVGNTNGINWPAAFRKEHYQNAIGLTFRVKIEGSAQNSFSILGKNWGFSDRKLYDAVGATDGWQEFSVRMDVAENYDLLNGMFWVFWTNGNMTVYVDSITVVEAAGAAAEPENMWHSFNDPFGAAVWKSGSVGTAWLKDYDGAEGVLKLDLSKASDQFVGNTDGVNWPAAFQKAHYQNAVGLRFRIKIEGDALCSMDVYGRNWGIKPMKLYDAVGATDGWQEFSIRMDVAANYDLLNGMFWVFWTNGDMTVYIDEITVVELAGTAEEPEDMWYSFGDPFSADVYGSPTKTWLESYDGAEGVLKLELVNTGSQFVGDTNGINWPAAFDKTHYENAVGLKFRVKIEGDALCSMEVYGQNWGIKPVKLYDAVGATDGWQEYIWTADVKESYDLLNGMFWTFWANGDMTVYIDQITVVEPEPEPPVTEPADEPGDMWYSFSDPNCWNVYGSPTKTWLESYDDAEGVLKLDLVNTGSQFVGDTNGINWPAAFDKTHYENAVGLKFRVKIEGDALCSMEVYGQNWGIKPVKLYDAVGATDGWQEYIWTADVKESYDLLNGMFWTFWANGDMTVYIDQITVVEPEPEPPVTEPADEPEDMWYSFSDPNCWNVYGSPTKTWLESYAGAEGVLKLDLVNVNGQFVGDTNGINWPAAFDKTHYEDAVGLKFRIKIEGDALNSMTVLGQNWAFSDIKLYDGVGATDGWQEYILRMDVAENFDALNGMFWIFWANGDMTVYIDQITVVEPEPEPPVTEPADEPEDMWYSFSDPNCWNVYGSPTKTWLESYDGAEGVLKIDLVNVNGQFVGDTNGINWPAAFDKTHYENAVGLKFRVKIEGDALCSMEVYGRNWGIKPVKLYDAVGATDGWQEYIWTADVKESYDLLNGMFWTFWANGDMTVYIDKITVVTA